MNPTLVKNRKAGLCRCGKQPVYFRRYEGLYYCKGCFIKSFEKKFKKTLSKYRLVNHGDVIVCGVSGGKDSSVLIYLMSKVFEKRKDIKIIAVTVDEGISGYRKETIDLSRKLCKSINVEHRVYSFKESLGSSLDDQLKKTKAKDYCTYCGVGRRYILNKASKDLKATKLCLGHNLDDESQSVIMNYMRGDLLRAGRMGSATKVLKGFIQRIKPLRLLPEKEIALYAILKGIKFSTKECPYISGLRPDVRNFINYMENKHPGTRYAILENYDKIVPKIKESVQYKNPLSNCVKCKEPSSQKVCKTCELWK